MDALCPQHGDLTATDAIITNPTTSTEGTSGTGQGVIEVNEVNRRVMAISNQITPFAHTCKSTNPFQHLNLLIFDTHPPFTLSTSYLAQSTPL